MYHPTLQEFKNLATRGNVVPVTRRLLADFETPLSAYRKIRGPGESFLFESVEGGDHLGRYSFVGCNPRAVVRQIGPRVEVRENGKLIESCFVSASPPSGGGPTVKDGLAVVERLMKKYRPVSLPGLPRFTGGGPGILWCQYILPVEA